MGGSYRHGYSFGRSRTPVPAEETVQKFLRAAYKGDIKELQDALNVFGHNIIEKKDAIGKTALLLCIEHGDDSCLRLLLQHGAERDVRDAEGHTALMAAAWWGKAESVSLLLQRGANAFEESDVGKTALMLAQQMERRDCINILRQWEADQYRRKEREAMEIRKGIVRAVKVGGGLKLRTPIR